MENYYQNQIRRQPQREYNPLSNLTQFCLQCIRQTGIRMIILSIVFFVHTAIVFVIAILILQLNNIEIPTSRNTILSMNFSGISFIYFLTGIIFYLIPGILLMYHATKLMNFSANNSIDELEIALSRGKSFWTYAVGLAIMNMIISVVGVIIFQTILTVILFKMKY